MDSLLMSLILEDKKVNFYINNWIEIRQYWSYYYDACDAIVFVVDAADDARIAECNDQLKALLSDEKLKKCPLLVYANKSDLEGVLEADEIMEKLELSNINDRDWTLFACSALKGTGVMEGMKWLLEKLASK